MSYSSPLLPRLPLVPLGRELARKATLPHPLPQALESGSASMAFVITGFALVILTWLGAIALAMGSR